MWFSRKKKIKTYPLYRIVKITYYTNVVFSVQRRDIVLGEDYDYAVEPHYITMGKYNTYPQALSVINNLIPPDSEMLKKEIVYP